MWVNTKRRRPRLKRAAASSGQIKTSPISIDSPAVEQRISEKLGRNIFSKIT